MRKSRFADRRPRGEGDRRERASNMSLLGFRRSAVRCVVRPREGEAKLRERLRELAAEKPRWGSPMLIWRFRREGFRDSHKRIRRPYRLEPPKKKRGSAWRRSPSLIQPLHFLLTSGSRQRNKMRRHRRIYLETWLSRIVRATGEASRAV